MTQVADRPYYRIKPAVRILDADSKAPLVVDEETGRHFEVGLEEAKVFRLLDGTRDIPDVARELGGGEDEIRSFVSRLFRYGLFEVRPPAKRKPSLLAGVRLFSIDPSRVARLLRPPSKILFHPLAGLVFYPLMVTAIFFYADSFVRLPLDALRPADWIAAAAVFLFVPFLHELAHIGAASAYGIRVRTCEFRLLLFVPMLYSETVAPTRAGGRKIAAAAGLLLETTLWSLSILLWKLAGAGWLPALGVLLLPSILLYLNPLLKLDGYYLFSEAAGISRLKETSLQYLRDRIARGRSGIRGFESFSPWKKRLLLGYALASLLFSAGLVAAVVFVTVDLGPRVLKNGWLLPFLLLCVSSGLLAGTGLLRTVAAVLKRESR